jgi:flagellar basal-body rod protein FlgB
MLSSWENILGVHEKALNTHAQRAHLLAENLANADTPNYKARDLDFKAVLEQQQAHATQGGPLVRSHARHLEPDGYMNGAEVLYRMPQQPSLDGNTVETQFEKSEYMQNAIRYQVSLQFLSSKFKGLKTAIRGE